MPFLAGVFSRLYSWQDDRDDGIDILADRHDAEDDNFAAGLNLAWLRDGTALPTQNIPMGGKRLIGLGAAVDPSDAVTKEYVDDNLSISNIGDYLDTERTPSSAWLKRDGSIKTQASYPALAALLGTKYASFSGFTAYGNYGSTNQIQDMAYGGGKFVSVEPAGIIKVSTNNGLTWSAKTSGTSLAFTRVGYGNGNYVAVGETGLICTSPDAETWTIRSSGTTEVLQGVTYADGRWVVVGMNGKILVSTDLVNWGTRTVTDLPSGVNFFGVAYGNGRYVIVGGSSAQGGIAVVSLDGASTFSFSKTGSTGTHGSVAYGNNVFVAAAGQQLYSSRSAVGAWAASAVSGSLQTVAFTSRNFFAIGSSFSTSSLNGVDWAVHTSLAGTYRAVAASPTHILIGSTAGALARANYALDIVTQFQLPADNPDTGYIKAL